MIKILDEKVQRLRSPQPLSEKEWNNIKTLVINIRKYVSDYVKSLGRFGGGKLPPDLVKVLFDRMLSISNSFKKCLRSINERNRESLLQDIIGFQSDVIDLLSFSDILMLVRGGLPEAFVSPKVTVPEYLSILAQQIYAFILRYGGSVTLSKILTAFYDRSKDEVMKALQELEEKGFVTRSGVDVKTLDVIVSIS
jgi:hypothetical protein